MSGRDLLYKPQNPIILDEDEDDKKVKKGAKGKAIDPKEMALRIQQARAIEQAKALDKSDPAKEAAFKAAYFNKDVSGARAVNQRASTMQALRGSEQATDLRKVVLPAGAVESPLPEHLNSALQAMGVGALSELSFQDLLGKVGAWARDKKRTAEEILARKEELERMVEDRKAALARMADREIVADTPLVQQAQLVDGQGLEAAEDVAGEATDLIDRTGRRAEGMHYRMAKTVGVKVPKPE